MTQQPDNQQTATVASVAFLTPGEHGHTYPIMCRQWGLDPIPGGWGLAMIQAPDGTRHTLFTSNVGYLQLLQTGVNAGVITDAEPEPIRHDLFEYRKGGWPTDWPGVAS